MVSRNVQETEGFKPSNMQPTAQLIGCLEGSRNGSRKYTGPFTWSHLDWWEWWANCFHAYYYHSFKWVTITWWPVKCVCGELYLLNTKWRSFCILLDYTMLHDYIMGFVQLSYFSSTIRGHISPKWTYTYREPADCKSLSSSNTVLRSMSCEVLHQHKLHLQAGLNRFFLELHLETTFQ